ncbi:prolyl-tRNA synthetase associated domain-containing protein [Candidatus Peribacteria bacterium]|nr:prolyl-tRNA synthetase associated domain-containing protein [Candidatus Peribacteria bacterium]
MDIYAFLDSHGISYQRFDHEAVFTCEQAKEIRTEPMPGKDTKNLFLRDEKGKRHFLVTVGHEKQVDIKALKKIFDVHPPSSAAADYGGVKKLSFASPERLKTYLGVDPGSVTLLGLVNDTDHAVEVFIDEAIWKADAVCCHPLVNTATLVIAHAGLVKFLQATGHAATVINVQTIQI